MKKYFASLLIVILLVSTLCVGAVTVAPTPAAAKTVPADLQATYPWSPSAAAFPKTGGGLIPCQGKTLCQKPWIWQASADKQKLYALIRPKKGQGANAWASLEIYLDPRDALRGLTYDQVKNWPIQIQLQYQYRLGTRPLGEKNAGAYASAGVSVSAHSTGGGNINPLAGDTVWTAKKMASNVPNTANDANFIQRGGTSFWQSVGSWHRFGELYKNKPNEAGVIKVAVNTLAYNKKSGETYTALADLTLTGVKVHFDPSYTPP